MDTFDFLLLVINVALVAAFYAEFHGVFDADEEIVSPNGLRPMRALPDRAEPA